MTVDSAAKTIWDYMQLHQEPKPADAIFVLCSSDTRVAGRAAELYAAGIAPLVILSGGVGELTRDIFNKPEAEVFADILLAHHIPEAAIMVEKMSTNTGENVRFTYDLLHEQNIPVRSMVLVQKPYMERRTYATFKQQWPDAHTTISVTSPRFSFEDYCTAKYPKELVLNIMLGDMQRIQEYPKLGYQIAQEIPESAWEAYEFLVTKGYTKHLIT